LNLLFIEFIEIFNSIIYNSMKNKTLKLKNFHYNNSESKYKNGVHTRRHVKIHGGKGHKTLCIYKKGKKICKIKKPLTYLEISKIKIGKFIPGLFKNLRQ